MRVLLILFLFFSSVLSSSDSHCFKNIDPYPNEKYPHYTPNNLLKKIKHPLYHYVTLFIYVYDGKKYVIQAEHMTDISGDDTPYFMASRTSKPGYYSNKPLNSPVGTHLDFLFVSNRVLIVTSFDNSATPGRTSVACSSEYADTDGLKMTDLEHISIFKLENPYAISSSGITFIKAVCNLDEDYNPGIGKCIKCPSGQKFDQASSKCYNDCTDTNNNKYGFTDGSCWDCSNKKTNDEIKKCYCQRAGSDYTPSKHLTYFDDGTVCPDCSIEISAADGTGRFMARCDNDLEFPYKPVGTLPVTPNKETDPNNPEKGETSTLPSTPIIPDDDANKPKPGDGIQPTPGDGILRPIVTGSGSITEPNPNYKPDNQDESDKNSNNSDDNKDGKDDDADKNANDSGSPNGKDSGSPDAKGNIITNITHNHYYGDEAKQSDGEYGDKGYDFSDYEKAIDDFEKKYTDELEDYASDLLKFVDKVQDTIKDYKTKSFKHLNSPSKKTSCPISSKVPIGNKVIDFSIDFCEVFHRFYTAFYSLFYFLFFVLFLGFSIKIFVLSFPQR